MRETHPLSLLLLGSLKGFFREHFVAANSALQQHHGGVDELDGEVPDGTAVDHGLEHRGKFLWLHVAGAVERDLLQRWQSSVVRSMERLSAYSCLGHPHLAMRPRRQARCLSLGRVTRLVRRLRL